MTNQANLDEIDAVLGKISEARARASAGAEALDRDGAPEALVTALRRTETQLGEDHRRLTQATLFAVVVDELPA